MRCRGWIGAGASRYGVAPARLLPMNFVEDVLESFPSARPALVAVSEQGERKIWGFGELSARSAGLGGALLARGVGRGDVVMTLIGSRSEWVLAMLACFRIGAVALPCNTQLRRADLEHRVAVANPALAIGEQRYLGELPDGRSLYDARGGRRDPRRGSPAGAAGRPIGARADGPGADRLHLGHDRRLRRPPSTRSPTWADS